MKKLFIILLVVVVMLISAVVPVSADNYGRRHGGRHGGRHGHNNYSDREFYQDLGRIIVLSSVLVGVETVHAVVTSGNTATYYAPPAPRRDICYAYSPTGYIDPYGRFVQTGQTALQVPCN